MNSVSLFSFCFVLELWKQMRQGLTFGNVRMFTGYGSGYGNVHLILSYFHLRGLFLKHGQVTIPHLSI